MEAGHKKDEADRQINFALTDPFRRDPNSGQDRDFAGYNFWLDKLDRFNGNSQEAEMVKGFLSSIEYSAQ